MQLTLKKALIVAAQEAGPGMFSLNRADGGTGGRLATGISIISWTISTLRSIFRALAVEPVPLDGIDAWNDEPPPQVDKTDFARQKAP